MNATGCASSSRSTSRRAGEVDAALQLLEAGRPAVARRARRSRRRAAAAPAAARASGSSARTIDGNCAVFSLPSRDQRRTSAPRLAGRDVDQRADAVVLRLVDAARAGQRRLGQRRQHRPHRRGVLAPAASDDMHRNSQLSCHGSAISSDSRSERRAVSGIGTAIGESRSLELGALAVACIWADVPDQPIDR